MTDTTKTKLYPGPRTREWCDSCMTMTRVVVSGYAMDADGVTRVATFKACGNPAHVNGVAA